MANPVHLEILKQGVKAWNHWRQTNILVLPDLSRANLSGMDLGEANLSETNLIRANLSRAELIGARLIEANMIESDLKEANLFGADLSGAELNRSSLSEANLIGAKLNGANLIGADLTGVTLIQASLSETDLSGVDLSRANLKQADLRGANCSKASLSKADLTEADLIGANLWQAGLKEANLTGANLWEADLRGSNLMGTRLVEVDLRQANLLQATVLDADFKGAILTGACIQDWVVNHGTNLTGAHCDYVYLRYDYNLPGHFLDRRPLNPKRNFAPDEFIQLVRTPFDTLDLIFADGIDWQAFFLAFQQLRHHYGEQTLAIQAIECKNWGAFVIRLEVDMTLDPNAIETFAQELYESHLQAIETDYQERFQLQGQQFSTYQKRLEAKRLANTKLDDLIQTQVTIQEQVLQAIAQAPNTPIAPLQAYRQNGSTTTSRPPALLLSPPQSSPFSPTPTPLSPATQAQICESLARLEQVLKGFAASQTLTQLTLDTQLTLETIIGYINDAHREARKNKVSLSLIQINVEVALGIFREIEPIKNLAPGELNGLDIPLYTLAEALNLPFSQFWPL
jgi:uncharacterized protein YjbI with pentapeptide repeats